METSSLQEIKSELSELSAKELTALCISLAKYKKDNKELLSYLLFQSSNRLGFIHQLKKEVDEYFSEIDIQKNSYYTKKSLRKVLRIINKYSKYIGDKSVTADLLLYFCIKMKQSKIPMERSVSLENIFLSQIKKIKTITATLHEDLQADIYKELEDVMNH